MLFVYSIKSSTFPKVPVGALIVPPTFMSFEAKDVKLPLPDCI
jgi:hypothetical protein